MIPSVLLARDNKNAYKWGDGVSCSITIQALLSVYYRSKMSSDEIKSAFPFAAGRLIMYRQRS